VAPERADHDHRPRPHLEAGSGAAVAADRHDPAAHPGTGKPTGGAFDHHQPPCHPHLTPGQRGTGIVTDIATDMNDTAGHAGGQPVAGSAGNDEFPSRHADCGVVADRAGDIDSPRTHPAGDAVDSGEVAAALDYSVGIDAACQREHLGKRSHHAVDADGESSDGGVLEPREPVGRDARQIDVDC
jgi:hypothetical protein